MGDIPSVVDLLHPSSNGRRSLLLRANSESGRHRSSLWSLKCIINSLVTRAVTRPVLAMKTAAIVIFLRPALLGRTRLINCQASMSSQENLFLKDSRELFLLVFFWMRQRMNWWTEIILPLLKEGEVSVAAIALLVTIQIEILYKCSYFHVGILGDTDCPL